MLEASIIKHCAPTLAGIKSANLFSYRFYCIDELYRELRESNEKLNGKGVYLKILRTSEFRALIYVYRKKKLEADLSQPEARELLEESGYYGTQTEELLEQLKEKLFWQSEMFPHEIGLFLGYPLMDVKGFIEQKGKNFKYSGIWKVYGNEVETIKLFKKLEKCSQIYVRLFAGGRSITQLTVAA